MSDSGGARSDGAHAPGRRLPDADTSPPAVRDALATAPDLAVFRLAAHAETVLPHWLRAGGALLHETTLPSGLRELAIVTTAVAMNSPYVRARHERAAADLGVPQVEIASVVAGELSGESVGDAGPVLRAVRELVETRTLGDGSLDAVTEQLGTRGAVELLLIVGHYVGLSLISSAAGLDADDASAEDA